MVEKPILVKINATIKEEKTPGGIYTLHPKVEVIDKASGRLLKNVTAIDIQLRPDMPIQATVTLVPEVNLETDDVYVRIATERVLLLEKVAEAAVELARHERRSGIFKTEQAGRLKSLDSALHEAGYNYEVYT